MTQTAKAVTIVEPRKLELREYTIPPLQPSGLLMQIEMSGICGTDKHTYRGETTQYGGTVNEQISPFPLIPGHENVGIVADITPGVVDFYGQPLRIGDRITMCPDVVCGKCYNCRHIFGYSWCEHWRGYGNSFRASEQPLMGGWSEYMVLIPEAFVYKVPDGLKPELAVYTEIMACTYALDKAKEFSSIAAEGFLSDDAVLIQGVGPLGLCHLIKARMMGAGTIIAMDRSEYRLKMAKAFGADHVVNVGNTSEALEGVFVDMGNIPLNPHLIVSKALRLIGLSNHPFTGYGPSMDLMLRYQDKMPLDTFVTHCFPLEEAQAAMDTALGLECMKVVFTPNRAAQQR